MLQLKNKISKYKAICICNQCHSNYECNYYDAKKSRIGHLCNKCKNIITNMVTFTKADLIKVFDYNPNTGDLIHKLDTKNNVKGTIATHKHNEGYLQISVGCKSYLAHRIIWFMLKDVWPDQIDHKNHIRSDNRLSNLSDVIHRKNQMNMSLKCNNSSGVNGVRVLPSKRYYSYIMVQGKQISLGTYDTLNEAKLARKNANIKYGFHKNHGN